MGTNGYLAVRHNGHTRFLYAQSDCHPPRMLAQVASTVLAAGVKALRDRLTEERMTAPSPEGFSGLMEMGDAYIQACQENGQSPFLLNETIGLSMRKPDFSHGGVGVLFAPTIPWSVYPPDNIEDASLILDLDREALVMPDWNSDRSAGSYDAGTMPVGVQLEFSVWEGMAPEQLYWALDDLGWHYQDLENTAKLSKHLEKARRGDMKQPQGWGHQDGPLRFELKNESERKNGGRYFHPRPYSPSVHTVNGGDSHLLVLQVVQAAMVNLQSAFPILGHPQTTFYAFPAPDEFELQVDLRQEDWAAQAFLKELCGVLPKKLGVVTESASPGDRTATSHDQSRSHSWAGTNDTTWDQALRVEKRWQASSDWLAWLAKEQADATPDLLENVRYVGIAALDPQRWALAESTGLLQSLSEWEWKYLTGMALDVATCFEIAHPGYTQQRWASLAEEQRQRFLAALRPAERFLLDELIKGIPLRQKDADLRIEIPDLIEY